MTEPPQIARGPEDPHFETTNATISVTLEECRKSISSASPRSEASAAPAPHDAALAALDRRAFRTVTPRAYKAFQVWMDWAEAGTNARTPRMGERDDAHATITAMRPFIAGAAADILDVWKSMLERQNDAA